MANPHSSSLTSGLRQADQAADHFGANSPFSRLFVNPWNVIGHAVPGTIIVDLARGTGGSFPRGIDIAGGAILTLLLFPWIREPRGSPWLKAFLAGESLTALGAVYWLTRAAGNTQTVSLLLGVAVGAFASMPLMPKVESEARQPRMFFANDPGGRLRSSNPYWGIL